MTKALLCIFRLKHSYLNNGIGKNRAEKVNVIQNVPFSIENVLRYVLDWDNHQKHGGCQPNDIIYRIKDAMLIDLYAVQVHVKHSRLKLNVLDSKNIGNLIS